MSEAAIGETMDILRDLPATDQEIVLQFLKQLKSRQNIDSTATASQPNPALRDIDGLLVYTGEVLGDPGLFLKRIRQEQDRKILGRVSPSTNLT